LKRSEPTDPWAKGKEVNQMKTKTNLKAGGIDTSPSRGEK
jgi:hypothetical protein